MVQRDRSKKTWQVFIIADIFVTLTHYLCESELKDPLRK